eukprot:gene91-828_t
MSQSSRSQGRKMPTEERRSRRGPSRSSNSRSQLSAMPSQPASSSGSKPATATVSGVIVAQKEIDRSVSKPENISSKMSVSNMSSGTNKKSVGDFSTKSSGRNLVLSDRHASGRFRSTRQPARRANSSRSSGTIRYNNDGSSDQSSSKRGGRSPIVVEAVTVQDDGYIDPDAYQAAIAEPIDYNFQLQTAFNDMPMTCALHKAQEGFPASCDDFSVLWLRGFMPVSQKGGSFFGPQFAWRPRIDNQKELHKALRRTGENYDSFQKNEMITRINKTLYMLRPPYIRALMFLIVSCFLIFIAIVLFIGFFATGSDENAWLIPGIIFLCVGIFGLVLGVFLPNRYISRNRKRDKQVEVNFQQFNTFFKLREHTVVYRSLEDEGRVIFDKGDGELEETFATKTLKFFGIRERVRCLIILHPGENPNARNNNNKNDISRNNTKNWGDVKIPANFSRKLGGDNAGESFAQSNLAQAQRSQQASSSRRNNNHNHNHDDSGNHYGGGYGYGHHDEDDYYTSEEEDAGWEAGQRV